MVISSLPTSSISPFPLFSQTCCGRACIFLAGATHAPRHGKNDGGWTWHSARAHKGEIELAYRSNCRNCRNYRSFDSGKKNLGGRNFWWLQFPVVMQSDINNSNLAQCWDRMTKSRTGLDGKVARVKTIPPLSIYSAFSLMLLPKYRLRNVHDWTKLLCLRKDSCPPSTGATDCA